MFHAVKCLFSFVTFDSPRCVNYAPDRNAEDNCQEVRGTARGKQWLLCSYLLVREGWVAFVHYSFASFFKRCFLKSGHENYVWSLNHSCFPYVFANECTCWYEKKGMFKICVFTINEIPVDGLILSVHMVWLCGDHDMWLMLRFNHWSLIHFIVSEAFLSHFNISEIGMHFTKSQENNESYFNWQGYFFLVAT